ncbi:putative NADPH-cytochrome P450 reductase (CprA) [Ilyonectria robusta]
MIHTSLKRHVEIARLSHERSSETRNSLHPPMGRDQPCGQYHGTRKPVRHRASKKITLAFILHHASPECPWKIPLSFLFERVPALKSRYYSIVSASTVQPHLASLAVNVATLQPDNPDGVVYGLTSHYLLGMLNPRKGLSGVGMSSDTLRTAHCRIRKSKFKAPVSQPQPMITVATGSGINPFRGFYPVYFKKSELDKEIESMTFCFSCRILGEPLYNEEFQAAEKSLHGQLQIITSYSGAGTSRGQGKDQNGT